jgi:RNA polymerase sigma-70 factor (ECF subfamily)
VTDPAARAFAFHAVFESELDYVCASLRRLGVRPSDLEDLAQDVFIAVYRHLDEYDRARPLRPWIFGFAYRTASNYRRLSRHRAEVLDARHEDAVASSGSPEDLLASQRLEVAFWESLDRLSAEQRAVFVMHELDERSGPEIAETLGIPLNTAYSRIRAARSEMAKFLGRTEEA